MDALEATHLAEDGHRLGASVDGAAFAGRCCSVICRDADVNFQVTVLKILAIGRAGPGGAAKAPGRDIWSQGLVERLSGG
jgi:hypothetical protein